MKPDAFVLAGGHGTRMGVDKARVPIPHRWPMAVTVAGVLRQAGHEVALIRRGSPDGLPWLWPDGSEIPVLYEPDDGDPHPLWGVATAMMSANTESVLVVPCDVPFLTARDITHLAAAAPQVASDGDRVHPLVACLPTSWAERAANAANAGSSVRRFVAGLPEVRMPAPHLRNVNQWSDGGVANPLDVLRTRLSFLSETAMHGVLDGEIKRLAARGVRLPGADR